MSIENDLQVGSRVFVHGLASETGAALNFRCGEVVRAEEDRRLGVRVAGASGPPKLIKRMNLLSAKRTEDRRLLLGLLALQRSPELRALRPLCRERLNDDQGLMLLVASYVTEPPMCLFQFGGFMRKVWPEHWRFADPAKPVAIAQPPELRLDCACCDMGLGRVFFAGGCGKHPGACSLDEFFNSAETYDSLTDEWSSLPAMPTRRHGACACFLDGKVYVLGGMYVDEERNLPLQEMFCDIFDPATQSWTSLPAAAYSSLGVGPGMFERAAFFGAAAVEGRVVALVGGVTIAYNPSLPKDGWRAVDAPTSHVKVGASSCSCAFQGELIVASGRPRCFSRKVAGFRFSTDASQPLWWHGTWRQLPNLNDARVGGALAVVYDRLYITGGVDEDTGEFYDTAERLEQNSWECVPWFQMPRALHAHEAHALPYLPAAA